MHLVLLSPTMQAINKMLVHRSARHGLLTVVFFTLLMTVWSLNLDFLIPNVSHAFA